MQNMEDGDKPDISKIIPKDPCVKIHTFQEKIMESTVYFQVIKLQDSFFLWLGKSKQFGDLSVAITMMGKTPSSSVLVGQSDSYTVLMARRLSKLTGKQVFVSGDLNFDSLEIPLVEKCIAEEMKNNADKFWGYAGRDLISSTIESIVPLK